MRSRAISADRSSARRLSAARQHRVDESVGEAEALIGLVNLPQIRGQRHALHLRHPHVCIADFQGKARVAASVRGEPSQIFQRRVDNQLPRLRAARKLTGESIDIEELVGQLAHFQEMPLRDAALVVGHQQARRQTPYDCRGSRHRGPVTPQEFAAPVPGVAAPGTHGAPFQKRANVVGQGIDRAIALLRLFAESLQDDEVQILGNRGIDAAGRRRFGQAYR